MKVLIVEDHPENVKELRATVAGRFADGVVQIAESVESAKEALGAFTFDLIILDRRLPTRDGLLDEHVSHGDALYAFVRSEVVGTPIRFWTAFPDDDYYSERMGEVQQEDSWGLGARPTVSVIGKTRFDQINRILDEISTALAALEQIEIRARPGKRVELVELERRVLRLAAKRLGGDALEVAPLGGGYSDAKVLRVEVMHGQHRIHLSVAKITAIAALGDELRRYQYLTRLLPGAAPNIVCQVRSGAGAIGGTFYQLAEGHEDSLFDVLGNNAAAAPEIVTRLRERLRPWTAAGSQMLTTVAELRRRWVSDETFARFGAEMEGLNLDWLEGQRVSWIESCCHGDCHGENVLVRRQDLDPILIDFGEVGPAPAAIDPLALELSAIFHGNGLLGRTGWPTAEGAAQWGNLDLYLGDCPYPEYVRACREWAWDVARGDRALYAVAYCVVLRQFKYPDTDRNIAKGLLRGIVQAYRETQ